MTMPKGWENKIQNSPDPTSSTGSESTIWSDEVTTGLFRKKVIETRYITNLRVSTNRGVVFLNQIDDIVVMNSKRMSQSQYTGYSAGRYTRFGMGNAKSNSRTVGDVVFMSGGKPVVIIDQVQDPHGVARLAKAARKQVLTQTKLAEKAVSQLQKTIPEITKAANVQRNPTSLDILDAPTSMHKPPEISWILTHSMIAPHLIKSYEYRIQIIKWIDGNQNEYYNKMIIHPIEKGNYIEFVNDNDKSSTLKIEIGRLVDVSNMGDKDLLGVKRVGDIKLQLTYSYILDNMTNIINPTEHTQSILVNVIDAEKDKLVGEIIYLKNIETKSLYWIKMDEYDIYPLIPFYGLKEHIGYYNILASNNNGVIEIKKIQILTSIRNLIYDYENHEGKYNVYQDFDNVEIKPNSEQSNSLYSSDIGPLSDPINPSNFKNLQSPKDVIFLSQGKEVFRFNEVVELEKLMKVISDINEQRSSKTRINDTASKIKTDDKQESQRTKISIKCSHCGKSVAADSKFCNHCGARVTPVCSKCNHENPVGSEFCSNCGFVLN